MPLTKGLDINFPGFTSVRSATGIWCTIRTKEYNNWFDSQTEDELHWVWFPIRQYTKCRRFSSKFLELILLVLLSQSEFLLVV